MTRKNLNLTSTLVRYSQMDRAYLAAWGARYYLNSMPQVFEKMIAETIERAKLDGVNLVEGGN